MTKKEAAETMTTLAAFYPAAKMTPEAFGLWVLRLQAYPADLCREAADRLSVRSKFFPSLAEIVSEIVAIHTGMPEPDEAWAIVATSQFLTPAGGWPCDEMKQAVKAAGGEWAWRHSTDQTGIRFAFVEAYRGLMSARREDAIEVELPALGRPALSRSNDERIIANVMCFDKAPKS